MTIFVSFLLVAAALVFVGWPFLYARNDEDGADEESLSPLERQKFDAYTAIKEAEFDLRMGKLSEPDFRTLTGKYREQALAAIEALDNARQRRGSNEAGAESAPRLKFCPACGERIGGGAKFCGGCGRSLRITAA